MMVNRRGYERVQDVDRPLVSESDRNVFSRPFPRTEIIWGAALLILGLFMIALGILIHTEHWENKVPGDFSI